MPEILRYKRPTLATFSMLARRNLPLRIIDFGIVHHIGGINFFNDKAKAMQEMLRVAKPGTKILVRQMRPADYVILYYL